MPASLRWPEAAPQTIGAGNARAFLFLTFYRVGKVRA